MSATGSAGVLTFESPWVVNQAASALRICACSALSVFPTIRPTSRRLHHKGIRQGADTGSPNRGLGQTADAAGAPPGRRGLGAGGGGARRGKNNSAGAAPPRGRAEHH